MKTLQHKPKGEGMRTGLDHDCVSHFSIGGGARTGTTLSLLVLRFTGGFRVGMLIFSVEELQCFQSMYSLHECGKLDVSFLPKLQNLKL